jgi:hypothetical protein
MESLDFVKMTRDVETLRDLSNGGLVNMISEKGRQYAMYIHHSFLHNGGIGMYYEPTYGEYYPTLTLRLDKGEYIVKYIEPETLKVLKEEKVVTDGSDISITCPVYNLDMAIKINAI